MNRWLGAPGEEMIMTSATTAPRGDGSARRDDETTEGHEEMRGNRWRI